MARAARIAGILLFVLAGVVALASVMDFLGHREAGQTKLGKAILLAAAVVMPGFGSRKRRLAALAASASLRAGAAGPYFDRAKVEVASVGGKRSR